MWYKVKVTNSVSNLAINFKDSFEAWTHRKGLSLRSSDKPFLLSLKFQKTNYKF
jgi:hypothetical protein